MNDIERRIKEQRTVEASHKNLMGFDGKLGCIIRSLGQPVVSQGTGGTYFDSTPMLDVWEIPDDNEGGWELDELHAGTPEEITAQIPVIDIEGIEQPEGGIWMDRQTPIPQSTHQIGWCFDGLKYGMHLELTYTESNNELIAIYKGYIVYRELAGDLDTYVPMEEWEGMIETLYVTAKKIKQIEKTKEKEEHKKGIKKKKETWLFQMKKKWGFQ